MVFDSLDYHHHLLVCIAFLVSDLCLATMHTREPVGANEARYSTVGTACMDI